MLQRAEVTGTAPLAMMSPYLIAAVVKAEDPRFFAHHGIDWTNLAPAAPPGEGYTSPKTSARDGASRRHASRRPRPFIRSHDLA